MIFNNSINILSREELIKTYIDDFSNSPERIKMLEGERYYKVENDILKREMIRYEYEQPVKDETKPNNKLAHGFMHLLVDDKVNYLLTKPYTLKCKESAYLKAVEECLGGRFQKILNKLGTEASNKGIGWLFVYINPDGEFKTMKVPSEQVIPIWLDNDHEELEAVIRYYQVEVYEGKEKKYVTKIEFWTETGVTYYRLTESMKTPNASAACQVILDSEMYVDDNSEKIELGHFTVNGQPQSWGKVPFIPFKNNDYELPDLQFVKTLIDNYDLTRSDIANLLEELRSLIYILKGYDGTDPTEFMRDLRYYRMVKVSAEEKAGVDKLEATINIDAAEKHYNALKKDIFDFGQGVDKNSDKLGNSPSGIALKFIYSGLDLKCNALEEQFKWGTQQLIGFIDLFLQIKGQGVSKSDIEIIFNRDIAINESQTIIDCQNSRGVISDKTIIANHPWPENVDEEISQMKEENKTSEPPLFDE